uniref:MORF/ORRM1/DAG-like MORF domain-containing protein n=1 Tax=Cucumis sativus TaxID=3659 RepID=A0A0A0KPX4_CUCSA
MPVDRDLPTISDDLPALRRVAAAGHILSHQFRFFVHFTADAPLEFFFRITVLGNFLFLAPIMALHSLRLRRSLSVLSTFYRYAAVSSQTRHSIFCPSAPSVSKSPAMISSHWPLRLSSIASYSRSSFARKKEPDKLILEGCDYNHWLITMDFKDSKPTPEEMVRTYEETCAKGLNISVEEAKQKMYACSTTLYQGFQAVMTEEESDKFRDLPGVEFVLPDAYIDPEKKEYGGDKYINGTIIPRPPPTQYGGRQEPIDRNGNPDQPRNERPPRTAPNSQGNSSFNQRGCMQGDGRHFRASENYLPQRPPKNYIPPQREQRDCVPPPGQGNYGSGFNPTQGGPYVLGGYRGHGAGTPYGQGQSHGSYPNFIEVRAILVVALIPHGVDRMGKVDIMVMEGMSYGQGQIFPSSTEGQEFSKEQECLMVKDRFIQALLKVKTFPI